MYIALDDDFDISYTNGDFTTDDLDTLITIALLSNDRATDDEVLAINKREGFWGNTIDNKNYGSKIWLQNGRNVKENLANIISWAENSLEFMENEGIIKSVEVSGSFTTTGVKLDIDITKLDNNKLTQEYII
jgi:phage gp46-like protein